MEHETGISSAIRRSPMVRLAPLFVSGLVLAPSFSIDLKACCALVVCALLAQVVLLRRHLSYARRWVSGLPMAVFFFAFGLLWGRLHDPREQRNDVRWMLDDVQAWEVRIQEVATDNGRMVRAWSVVEGAIDDEGHARPVSGRLQLTLLKAEGQVGPYIGDRLLVAGRPKRLERIPDPGGFDARGWASAHGTEHTCFAPIGHWSLLEPAKGLSAWFEAGRQRITAWLVASGLADRERASVKAVLLGLRDELTADQKEAYIRSGTMHVLAVSGGHVAFIYGGLLLLLARLGGRRSARILRGVLILVVLWTYAGLTGASPSVLRATLTCSLFTVADMARGRVDPLNSLCAAAFVLLLIDPVVLGQLGFQLSFLAVLGIILCYRPMLALWTPPGRVLHYFWTLLVVSLSAQVFTLPVSLLMFQAFPVWFVPANLLVVGMVFVAVYLGFFLVLLHWVPVLGTLLSWITGWWLVLLDRTAAFFAWLPAAYPAVRIDGVQCFLLYLLVVVLSLWWLRGWRPARILALGCCALFLLAWGAEARRHNAQQGFVVYDDRDTLTMALVQGRALTVFGDSSDRHTRQKVERHMRAAGVEAVQWAPTVPASLQAGATTVWVDPEGVVPAEDGASVLLFNKWFDHVDTAAIKAQRVAGVVFGPSCPERCKRTLAVLLHAEGVAMHDVRRDGAYVRGR